MPIETIKQATCDLCKRSEQLRPDCHGWVTFEAEHPIHERDWVRVVICRSCADKIVLATPRDGGKPPGVTHPDARK